MIRNGHVAARIAGLAAVLTIFGCGGGDEEDARCKADTFVSSGRCVACPSGTRNEAGDDPSKEDTQCQGGTGDACLDALGVSCSSFSEAYVKSPEPVEGDLFGHSVSISGDTLVVGAPDEDSSTTGAQAVLGDGGAAESGAVFVFTRSGTTWTLQAILKASNTGAGDGFGQSVALEGETLVVGAPREDGSSTGVNGDQSVAGIFGANSGAAYVFVRSGSTWTQQAYVKASNTGMLHWFGTAVALSGNTLVVGAPNEASSTTGVNGSPPNSDASGSGAAYVFVRSGTSWTQQAYVKASNTGSQDQFGTALALDGNTLAVGASGESSASSGVNGSGADDSAWWSGAAYVFTRSGATWTQQAYLKASNPDAEDRFGNALALRGETLAVGAFLEASGATGVNGDQQDNDADNTGAVYVFTRSGTTWVQDAYLKSAVSEPSSHFGTSLALDGNVLAIGAPMDSSGARGLNGGPAAGRALLSGAVHLFLHDAGTWTQQATLKASNTGAEDVFGSAVALDGDSLCIGAPYEASGVPDDEDDDSASKAGAAYVRRIAP